MRRWGIMVLGALCVAGLGCQRTRDADEPPAADPAGLNRGVASSEVDRRAALEALSSLSKDEDFLSIYKFLEAWRDDARMAVVLDKVALIEIEVLAGVQSGDIRFRYLCLDILREVGRLDLVSRADAILYHIEFFIRARYPDIGRPNESRCTVHAKALCEVRTEALAALDEMERKPEAWRGRLHYVQVDTTLLARAAAEMRHRISQ